MQVVCYRFSMIGEHFLRDIAFGRKKYEGRVFTEKYKKIKVGDVISFYEIDSSFEIGCKVTSLNNFSSFRDMIQAMGVVNLLPQLEQLSKKVTSEALISEAIRIYSSFPGAERVHSCGCVAIGVKFLKRF